MGKTQEEFAEMAGLSVDFLSLIERGRNAPSFKKLELMIKGLDVSAAYLSPLRTLPAAKEAGNLVLGVEGRRALFSDPAHVRHIHCRDSVKIRKAPADHEELRKAHIIIDVQKKVAALLGHPLADEDPEKKS
jgi:transcriptional regulator with XRE-family HTH domain